MKEYQKTLCKSCTGTCKCAQRENQNSSTGPTHPYFNPHTIPRLLSTHVFNVYFRLAIRTLGKLGTGYKQQTTLAYKKKKEKIVKENDGMNSWILLYIIIVPPCTGFTNLVALKSECVQLEQTGARFDGYICLLKCKKKWPVHRRMVYKLSQQLLCKV